MLVGSDSDSGEAFDFGPVDAMDDSDDELPNRPSGSRQTPNPPRGKAIRFESENRESGEHSSGVSNKTLVIDVEISVVRRSTFGPRSKQKDLDIISVPRTANRGPDKEAASLTTRLASTTISENPRPRGRPPKKQAKRQAFSIDIPPPPPLGANTRARTAAAAATVTPRVAVGAESASVRFQKSRMVKRSRKR